MSHQCQVFGPVQFPTPALPEDGRLRRLLGIYPQRDSELLLLRVKVPGGRLTSAQWRSLARLAAAFTPDYPLHLTTRQDVELHGVPPAAIPEVQCGIAGAGLTSLGSCGDTPRNITLCPAGGICGGHGDLWPLVLSVKAYLEGLPEIHNLPRKFKISFSGCREACAQPWINDLGFVLTSSETADVIGAGSLGFKPGTGVLLARGIGIADVFPCLLAAIRIFQKLGDREHRMRARLRHVRERLGNEAFLQLFEAEFAKARREGGFPYVSVPPIPAGVEAAARLLPPKGDVTPAQAERLADLCDAHQAWASLENQHGIRIFGHSTASAGGTPGTESLRRALERDALLAGLLSPLCIVSCPGTTWCIKGIADSRAMSERLRTLLEKELGGRQAVTVCISGCPNQCAQSGVAPIGLVGLVRTINGVRTECFRILARGGMGKSPVLAREMVAAAPASETPRIIAQLLENWESFITI